MNERFRKPGPYRIPRGQANGSRGMQFLNVKSLYVVYEIPPGIFTGPDKLKSEVLSRMRSLQKRPSRIRTFFMLTDTLNAAA